MNFLERVKNLWKLSEYEAGAPQDEYKQPGTQIVTLIKKPQPSQGKVIFIPRIKERPIDKVNSI